MKIIFDKNDLKELGFTESDGSSPKAILELDINSESKKELYYNIYDIVMNDEDKKCKHISSMPLKDYLYYHVLEELKEDEYEDFYLLIGGIGDSLHHKIYLDGNLECIEENYKRIVEILKSYKK